MKMLDNLSELPSDVKFRTTTGKEPCEDADYVFYHKYLKFYSCFFNINKSTRKGRKRNENK